MEPFFTWIMQHLRIKRFCGMSKPAVKSRIRIPVSAYVLIAIVKTYLILDTSLYTVLVFSLTLFEKMPRQDAFAGIDYQSKEVNDCNQLTPFTVYPDSSVSNYFDILTLDRLKAYNSPLWAPMKNQLHRLVRNRSIAKGTTTLVSNSAKFHVIRLYLRQQFPKHHIADFQEGTSRAQVFRVDGPQGHPLHYAVLGLDFLLNQTAESLEQTLLSSGLGEKLKEAGASPVTVSKTGFSIEGTIALA